MTKGEFLFILVWYPNSRLLNWVVLGLFIVYGFKYIFMVYEFKLIINGLVFWVSSLEFQV